MERDLVIVWKGVPRQPLTSREFAHEFAWPPPKTGHETSCRRSRKHVSERCIIRVKRKLSVTMFSRSVRTADPVDLRTLLPAIKPRGVTEGREHGEMEGEREREFPFLCPSLSSTRRASFSFRAPFRFCSRMHRFALRRTEERENPSSVSMTRIMGTKKEKKKKRRKRYLDRGETRLDETRRDEARGGETLPGTGNQILEKGWTRYSISHSFAPCRRARPAL